MEGLAGGLDVLRSISYIRGAFPFRAEPLYNNTPYLSYSLEVRHEQ